MGVLNFLKEYVEALIAIPALWVAVKTNKTSRSDVKKSQLRDTFMQLIELLNIEKEKINKFDESIIKKNQDFIDKNPDYSSKDIKITTKYKINQFTGSHYYKNENIKKIVRTALENGTGVIEIDDLVDDYERNYVVFGSYFKIFHRIIKILNSEYSNKVISKKEYCNYIGILRSQFQNEDFLLLLFNAIISPRGTGMGVELLGSGFFGTEVDIEIKQHFRFDDDLKVNNRKLKNILKMFTFEYRDKFMNINRVREQVRNKYDQDSIRQISKKNTDKSKSFYNYIKYIKKLEQ